MFRRFLSWFRAGRNDPILFLVCLLVLASVALPSLIVMDVVWFNGRWNVVENGTLIGLSAIAGLLVGLSAIFANPRSFSRFDRWLSVLGVVLMVVLLFWSANLSSVWGGKQLEEITWRNSGTSWLGWSGVGLLVGIFIVVAVVVAIADWLSRRLTARIGSYKLTRTRGLVAIAAVLFVFALIRNIFGAVFSNMEEVPKAIEMTLVGGGIACGVLIPVLVTNRIRSFWYRAIWAGLLCGFSASILIMVFSSEQHDPTFQNFGAGAFFGFLAIALTVVPPVGNKQQVPTEATETSSEQVSKKALGDWSPIGSVLLLLTMVGSVLFVYLYEPVTLMSVGSASRWELARKMRKLNCEPNVDFFGVAFSNQNSNYSNITIHFSADSNPNFLNQLEGFTVLASLTIVGVTPEINLSSLSKLQLSQLSLKESQIDQKQLQYLTNSNSYLQMDNVNYEGSSQSVTPNLNGWWTIQGSEPGEISQLLGAVTDFKGAGNISLHECECDLGDWKELVRASQECQLRIGDTSFPRDLFDHWEQQEGETLRSMSIYRMSDRNQALRMVFDTDVRMLFSALQLEPDVPAIMNSESYWPMLLIAGDRTGLEARLEQIGIRRGEGPAAFEVDLTAAAIENSWSMAESDSGTIESFYFPGVTKQLLGDLTGLPQLKRLSLDWRWIDENTFPVENLKQYDTSSLGNFTALESLQLPSNLEPRDLLFLGKLTRLRELQISPNREAVNKPGLEQCTSLRKLTLLNTPSGQVLKEVKQLKMLEELVILDLGYQLQDPKVVAALRAKFPQVKVTIVKVTDYQGFPTKEFEAHLFKVKAKTRSMFIKD
jgi:hypothetical protein